jgi:hypothetical protein
LADQGKTAALSINFKTEKSMIYEKVKKFKKKYLQKGLNCETIHPVFATLRFAAKRKTLDL